MPKDSIVQISEITAKLKPHLPDYLEEHWFSKGNRPTGDSEEAKFRCFAHPGDDTPSMQFVKDSNRQAVICFGCRFRGDILRCASQIENLPVEGKEWITNTLATLCRRYGVDMGSIEVSNEELRILRMRQLAKHTNDLLQELGTTEQAIGRGLTEASARAWGILSIPSTQVFFERLKALGSYKDSLFEDLGWGYRDRDGVYHSKVFGPNLLTIPLRSSAGHVVGFTGRNLDFRSGAKNGFPKYCNTKKSEIFDKSTILYGFDKMLKAGSRPTQVYIFEGYFDVVLAHQMGLTNAVACCGTEISAPQIQLLQEASIHHIIICFDRDPNDAGWKAMDNFIVKTFQGYDSLRVEVLEIPLPYHDPDDFLKDKGVEAFRTAQRRSAFQWRMVRRLESGVALDSDFVNEMVNLIAMEPSPIYRSDMERELAEFSNRTISEIRDAVKAVLDRKEASFTSAVETLKVSIMQRFRAAHGASAIEEIRAAAAAADQLEKTYLEGEIDTVGSTIELIDRMILADAKDRPISIWKTGMSHYDKVYDGIPQGGVMIGLLGNPSAGKSSFCSFLAKELIEQNDKGIAVLFHSTDDAKFMVIRKIISAMSGVQDVRIRRGTLEGWEKKRVADAAMIVKEWLADHRLEVRDASDGFEVPYAERWIKQFRDKHGDKKVVYFLDNFYKTWVDAGDNVRTKIEASANRIQLMTQQEDMVAICTLEPKKTYDRPRLRIEDIKETKKIRQNVHICWILHNGSPSDGSASEFITSTRTWKGERGTRPMVELQIAKNKDYPTGSVFMQFEYDTYSFKPTEFINQTEMNRMMEENRVPQTSGYGGYKTTGSGGTKLHPNKTDYFDGEEKELDDE